MCKLKVHKGKIIAKKDNYNVIDCRTCGFKHLDPIPTESELANFYQRRYYALIKEGERRSEISRQMTGDKEAHDGIKWLNSTLYEDIRYVLGKNCKKLKRRLLDIGCGTGKLMRAMKGAGWEVMGIEPSEQAVKASKNSNLAIYNMDLGKFLMLYPEYKSRFHAVTLMNVLEHVSDPIKFLRYTKELLHPQDGLVCICVPNDFNEFQFYAKKKLGKSMWWISAPDHINYFNFKSLQTLLRSVAFEIIYTSSDFPMEVFLLMGEDYTGNVAVGKSCHKRRVSFELALSDDTRRRFYQNLSKIEIGRCCFVIAKPKCK